MVGYKIMKNKLLLSLMLIVPIICNAEDGSPFDSKLTGINYVSFKKSSLPDDVKNKMLKNQEELNKNGYVENENSYVDFLLNIKKGAAQEIRSYKSNPNMLDTHLKSSVSEIQLAITFKEISFIKKDNVIGFAAVNTYSKVKGNEGWEGITEFFTDPIIGTCSYEYDKIKAVILNKEFTNTMINGKPTHIFIEGTKNTGYLYSINWYTNDRMSMLRCANMKYDRSIMNEMISFSKTIDHDR
jgi:hypothetical protein